jgi:hypothetical protein
MSITPNVPPPNDPVRETQIVETSTPRWVPVFLVILLLALAALGYMGYTARAGLQNQLAAANARADLLNKQLDETNSRVAQLRGQQDVTSQKLGLTQNELARARTLAQQIQQQQRDSDAKIGQELGQVQQTQQASDQKINQVSTDLSGARGDIASTQKDLADTKAKLTSTVGDLGVQSGLIARNREDLEALKRMGERNFVDFNLSKTKTPQRVGPIQVILRNTDPKKYRFSMTVVADDKAIEKNNRNVDEPMQFYVGRSRSPYELVVFQVTKDKVTGYLSMPKDAAASGSAAAPSGGTARP